MRTTVTLDPEVEALVRIVMRERRISFKEAVNTAVRLGRKLNFHWDKARAAADAIENE